MDPRTLENPCPNPDTELPSCFSVSLAPEPTGRIGRWGRSCAALRAALYVALTVVAPVPTLAAEWFKLSDGLPFSDVRSDYQVSADSKWVVYAHDATGDEVYELYSVPVSGGVAPVRISGLLPVGGLSTFRVSPDSQRVVYVAKQDQSGVAELYSVPIDGSAPSIRLNGDLVADGDVFSFEIHHDSQRVVYIADQEVDHRVEIFSASIDGGEVIRLNNELVAGTTVNVSYDLSDSGDWVVFRETVGSLTDCYSVSILGGSVHQVSPSGAQACWIDPTALHVVSRAGNDGVFELFSAPIEGGEFTQLNGALVEGGSVDPILGVISPDGTRVAYSADQQVEGLRELYSVPIAGGEIVKLNPPLQPDEDVLGRWWAPDSQRVVFSLGSAIDRAFFSVPATGGDAVRLTREPEPGDHVIGKPRITADGLWVVYAMKLGVDPGYSLLRVPLEGPAGDAVVVSSWDHAEAWTWELDPSRPRVFTAPAIFGVHYPRLQPLLEPLDPLGVPLVGPANFATDGDVQLMRVAADGSLVYLADQDFDEEFALYSVPALGLFRDGFESGDATAWSSMTP